MKSFKKYKEELEERGYSVLDKPSKSKPNENITLYKDHEFVARIRYNKNKGGRIKFGKNLYNDTDELLAAINQTNEKLPFPVDTYNPMIIDEYRRDARVDDTLRKFGFAYDKSSRTVGKYMANGELGMVFGEVYKNALLIGPHSRLEIYDENAKTDMDIKKSISSFLFAYYAANIAKMCENLNKSETLQKLDGIKVKKFNERTLELTETDVTERIIGVLENALEILKKKKTKKEYGRKQQSNKSVQGL